jgi:putative heme iron utilization protein
MSTSDTKNDPQPLPVLARTLLHRTRTGVLSTASAQHEGWPFGSLAPYAVTQSGDLALVLSDLAEHTKNLRHDARASLFVNEAVPDEDDPQSGARIALLGRVAQPQGDALADARARYIARFPEADGYLSKLDFHVYVLTVEHVRLVGGFGRVAWLPVSSVREDMAHDPIAEHAMGILTHMNDDHADSIANYVRAFRGRTIVSEPRMVGIDAWGFDVVDSGTGERFRFDFRERCTDADAVRMEVVRMSKQARAMLANASSEGGARD